MTAAASPAGVAEALALPEGGPVNATATRSAQRYRCGCQCVYQVFGGGRHRRFYELADFRWEQPLMTGLCPSCQRQLPTTRDPLAL